MLKSITNIVKILTYFCVNSDNVLQNGVTSLLAETQLKICSRNFRKLNLMQKGKASSKQVTYFSKQIALAHELNGTWNTLYQK